MLSALRPHAFLLTAGCLSSFLLVANSAVTGAADPLPGTKLLTIEAPLDEVMVDGIDRFALRELDDAPNRRAAKWNRDYTSVEAYLKSVAGNRERLRTIIGAVDPREKSPVLQFIATSPGNNSAGSASGPARRLGDNNPPKYGAYSIYYVRWPVMEGVTGEGILLQPLEQPKARVIVLPDADWTPEDFAHPGLTHARKTAAEPSPPEAVGAPSATPQGVSAEVLAASLVPRELANQGCQVLVPMLISRSDEFSGNPLVAYTNQPHREFVYRMAFEMGRHVIGYEVQKVMAAVDAFEWLDQHAPETLPAGNSSTNFLGPDGQSTFVPLLDRPRLVVDLPASTASAGQAVQLANSTPLVPVRSSGTEAATPDESGHYKPELPIGVAGIGEGGLIALFSAAVDPRVDAAMVCGYFQKREGVWEEPIYRNVWSQLTEFGDAEIAGLIAPRPLIIEACAVPEVAGPPEPRQGRRSGAAPGKIEICTLGMVRSEYDRAMPHYEKLNAADRVVFSASGEGNGPPGTATASFLKTLGVEPGSLNAGEMDLHYAGHLPAAPLFDPVARQKRQVEELVEFTQNLMHRSDKVRAQVWSKADRSSPEAWAKTAEFYRDFVYDELIGRLPKPTMPPNVRTRQIIDEKEYTGYDVVIDVYPDVIASGILLLPTDLKKGEKRPVVVCQHGLEGTPMSTISDDPGSYGPYKSFSVQLVKRGFIVYAPQNPYRGRDRFRTLQRKSNPLQRSLFSYIIPQHERTLEWLASLPYVDGDRIGFYGLSYGGKTAVRVPPMVKKYALSICSADFNEWVRKNTTVEDRYSYIFTGEYEIFEWNMGHVANYAELSTLMTPRPFMVERGHNDGVAPDEWVAWEFAKVFRHYDQMGLGDRAEIEFFDGPHTINGKGTFEFLHRHLNWPKPD